MTRAQMIGPGRTLVDLGQNLVGWVRCIVRGEPGSVITLRHAEVLEHGELGVAAGVGPLVLPPSGAP